MLKLKTDYVKIISDRENHTLSLVYPDGLRYVVHFYTDDDAADAAAADAQYIRLESATFYLVDYFMNYREDEDRIILIMGGLEQIADMHDIKYHNWWSAAK